MHAEICPVCNGKGVVDKVRSVDTVMERLDTCHCCHGQCWVEVSDASITTDSGNAMVFINGSEIPFYEPAVY